MQPIDSGKVLRNIGRRVAELRREKKLTQQQLADTARCSMKYVQRIEAGGENLTVGSLVKFANVLGIGMVQLLRAPRSRVVKRGRPPGKRTKTTAGRRG